MSRRNFWDVIQNIEINPIEEVRKIEKLFSQESILVGKWTTIEKYIDEKFLFWKDRGTSLNIEDFRKSKYIITWQDIENFSSVHIDDMFLYFEFIRNMFSLISDCKDKNIVLRVITIMQNINSILENYNQKLFHLKDKDIYIITENSEKATSVSELYPDIASKIIQYNRFALKGDLQRKKELLFAIWHKFEGVEAKLKQVNNPLCQNVSTLINNLDIRHNNKEGHEARPIVQKMSNEELEKWYDRTYDTLLLALLYADYSEYQGEIKDLNKVLKVK
jgi:hypothetical protein